MERTCFIKSLWAIRNEANLLAHVDLCSPRFSGGKNKNKDVKICETKPIHWTCISRNRLREFSSCFGRYSERGCNSSRRANNPTSLLPRNLILKVGKNPSPVLMGRCGSAISILTRKKKSKIKNEAISLVHPSFVRISRGRTPAMYAQMIYLSFKKSEAAISVAVTRP